jgi:predicted metal-binding membrane protein
MTGFAVAYLAVWAVFGFLVQAAVVAVRGIPSPQALAVALIVAVAWQLSPAKRSLLRACHRAAATRAAAVSPMRQGLRYGLCCLGACWCLMLVMVAVPAGQLLWPTG